MSLQPYAYLLRILFIGVLGLLTYLLLIEMAPSLHPIPYWDKLQHIVAFGGVTVTGVLAFQYQARTVMVGLSAYGAVMELLQGLFTATRKPSMLDWMADNVGLLLAGWLTLQVLAWLNARHGRV